MGIRTEFFDRTLQAALDSVGQVVILGAGWDTRAYGMLDGWNHPVFEVAAWLTENGLDLRDYDLLDGRGKMPLYGFVLASLTY